MKPVKCFFLLIAVVLSLQVYAQQTVEGTVMDQTKEALIGATVRIKGTKIGIATDEDGKFKLTLSKGDSILVFEYVGFKLQEVKITPASANLAIVMQPVDKVMNEFVVTALGIKREEKPLGYAVTTAGTLYGKAAGVKISQAPGTENESYAGIKENDYHSVTEQPLSTFSIDVDRAAYSNVRRYLNNGSLPPSDAVRIEELINYFDYQYQPPANNDPVAIYTDMATCPWAPTHQLVRVALKAKEVSVDKLPPATLVFLLDVSGSMDTYNKLPLVKQALTALVQQLRSKDKVAIVTYASAAKVVLPATAGSEKQTILNAIDMLQTGGGTAGGDGLKMAYEIAEANFMKDGNNRIIMATDGDFNVGESSEDELQKLIEKKRTSGVSLSVLGFGMGNYKDNMLELLADKGNGNYAYIDNFEEARRTFVKEFGSTLFTIAKDVKLQLEFNPQYIQSYRLVGYENRMLENKDFNDDQKDAGDMGVGHTVTALYEIIPAGSTTDASSVLDTLKYQRTVANNKFSGEALTVKLRYKNPKENKSHLLTKVMPWQVQEMSEDFKIAAAAATFGLLLRNSAHKGIATYDTALSLAKDAKGKDEEGDRAAFIQLIKSAAILAVSEKK